MEITVHLPDVAKLADAINNLVLSAATTAAEKAPVSDAPKKTTAKKTTTKKPDPEPEKEEATPETSNEPEYSQEDVRALVQAAAKKDRASAKAVLNQFAEHFNDVSKDDYPALVEALKKVG